MGNNGDREIEALIDSAIRLDGRDPDAVAHAFRRLSAAGRRAKYLKLLLSKITCGQAASVDVSPAALGSYFTSRATLLGIGFPSDIKSCMYSLSNSVKALSPIDVLRWRYVLSRLVRRTGPDGKPLGAVANVARRLLRQTHVVFEALSRLANSEELRWEKQVLRFR
jgi:hypothetical protein